MSEYVKSITSILRECDDALKSLLKCQAYDGTKCSPNDSDLDKAKSVRYSIAEFCHFHDIKL